jgi:hypothetical protein
VKHRAPKEIRERRKQSKKQPKSPKCVPLLWRLLKLTRAVIVVLAAVSGVWFWSPRLSIGTSGSIRPLDPMGTVFVLSNDGALPIFDIKAACKIEDLTTLTGIELSDLSATNPDSRASILSASKKMALPCHHIFATASPASARIAIEITYKPFVMWWSQKASFLMEAERVADGTWIWKMLPS